MKYKHNLFEDVKKHHSLDHTQFSKSYSLQIYFFSFKWTLLNKRWVDLQAINWHFVQNWKIIWFKLK